MSIKVDNVSKSFGSIKALDDVSVCFEEGKIYGLLGRNGAGKSTLLNIIANHIFASEGSVTIDGKPTNDNTASLLYLMNDKMFYPEDMRVHEAVKWQKRFFADFDSALADRLISEFSVNPKAKIRKLSTGYTSIFKLIMALCTNTKYILFDEPVLGLDANNRDLFYRVLLERYSEKQFTVIISTHLIEEISSIIEHVVIIKDGKVIEDKSREELLCEGYTVSGVASEVDDFIKNKSVIGTETLGGLKTAFIKGKRPTDEINSKIEISPLDLQKMFIKLTD